MECPCRVCQETCLEEMQQAFMEAKSYRRTSTGQYKSYYYAKIALHNFEMETKTLTRMVQAIEADDSLEALVHHASTARGIQGAVNWLIENNNEFAAKMSRTVLPASRRSTVQPAQQTLSLNYTPDSFSIPPNYKPLPEKRILLTIPCAGKKPYSLSRTHSIVNTKPPHRVWQESGGPSIKSPFRGSMVPSPKNLNRRRRWCVMTFNYRLETPLKFNSVRIVSIPISIDIATTMN